MKRGVGMFVAPGARARLSESERSRFLKEEWPQIRARMKRLGHRPARSCIGRASVTLNLFQGPFS